MTIDELAQRTRLTVRNIRAYQSRGLLQPPELRGRTGYYDDAHVARLELIREVQSEGFNLAAIGRLIEGAGGETEEVLRFTRAVREPFEREEPREVDLDELSKTWGDRADPRILARALDQPPDGLEVEPLRLKLADQADPGDVLLVVEAGAAAQLRRGHQAA